MGAAPLPPLPVQYVISDAICMLRAVRDSRVRTSTVVHPHLHSNH